MIKKYVGYYRTAIFEISAPEILSLVLSIAIYCICGDPKRTLYLWLIITICELLVIGAHGAWVPADDNPRISPGPWLSPTPLLIKFICAPMLISLNNRADSQVSTYLWYVLTVPAVFQAFHCILKAMHSNNDSWLAGTNGRIGIPNWISVSRMAISVLVPHLYTVQPFGQTSCIIATVLLGVAILTDSADGYVARRFNQTTKAGKALDPLGDKVIFYPTAIAFVIATNGTGYLPFAWQRWIFYIAFIAMITRDALVIIWFALRYNQLKDGMSAGMLDKIRMTAMCIWLGLSALAMTIRAIQERMAIAGLYAIVIVAALSIASPIIDYRRVQAKLNNLD